MAENLGMVRLLRNLFIIVFVVLIGISVAIFTIVPGYLKKIIEIDGTKAMKATITVKKVAVVNPYPLTFAFYNLTMRSTELAVKIPLVKVELNLMSFSKIYPKVVLDVLSPDIKYELVSARLNVENEKKPAPSLVTVDPKAFLPAFLSDFSFEIVIRNFSGSYKVQEEVKKAQFGLMQVKMDSLVKPIVINLEGDSSALGMNIPIKFNGNLDLKPGLVNLTSSVLDVLSIKSEINGYYKEDSQGMDFVIKSNIPKLDAVPLPKDSVIKSWSGEIQLDGRIFRKDGTQPPYLLVNYQLKDFKPQLSVKNREQEITGTFSLSSTGEVKYYGDLTVKDMTWDLDATQSAVSYRNLFMKPAGVELKSQGKLNWDKKVVIKSAVANLERLSVKADGFYEPKGNSDISFALGPAKLNGMEKYFPPIKKYPLEGEVEAKGLLSGVLSDPNKIAVDIRSLVAKKVKGNVEYQSEGLFLKGPVNLNLQSRLQMKGTDLSAGQASAFADVTDLEIKYKDVFVKKPGQSLRLEMEGEKSGNEFQLKKGSLLTYAGKMELRGRPPLHANDKLKLSVFIPGLELQKLGGMLPSYKQWLVPGDLSGKIDLEGQLNSADFSASNISTRGAVEVNIKEFSLRREGSVAGTSMANEPSSIDEPMKPFLPNCALILGINLDLKAHLNRFLMDRLDAQDMQMTAKLANSEFKISAGSIGRIFSGKINIKKVKIPLTRENPRVELDSAFTNIELIQALGWIKPEWGALAKGQASGEVSGSSFLPSFPRFMEKINAQGNFQIKNGFLNTVNFEAMAKEALGKIPGAGAVNILRGPLQADMVGDFTFDDGVLILNSFKAVTPHKEEASLSGKLALNMDIDMSGEVTLVDVAGGGDFWEANKDEKGRIVVPAKITGNALKPNLSFAESTISTMVKKLGEYELKKNQKKLKEIFK